MDLEENKIFKSKLALIFSMTVFGTIGIFVRYIPLSSSIIAALRGLIGATFLYFLLLLKGKKISVTAVKNNLKILMLSGGMIGIHWMFLFEAYNYTSIAMATLCYYLAPVFIILLSPIFLKEKLTVKKLVCALTALIGMVFVSGVIKGGIDISRIKGILYGVSAALFYAGIVILTKKLKDINAYEMTTVQLAAAGFTVLPYALFTGGIVKGEMTGFGFLMLLIVGLLHTGINYAVYFGAIKTLDVQTSAIFSYIDPVVAILLSTLFLRERIDIYGIIGAVIILGATFVSEISVKKTYKT